MNKSQLIDALAARLGDRRTAASAVDGLLSTIVETVQSGESVSLTGFGVFEARARAARVGRNPRTGQTVAVPAATVPAFRPGTAFRTAVGGSRGARRGPGRGGGHRPKPAQGRAKAKTHDEGRHEAGEEVPRSPRRRRSRETTTASADSARRVRVVVGRAQHRRPSNPSTHVLALRDGTADGSTAQPVRRRPAPARARRRGSPRPGSPPRSRPARAASSRRRARPASGSVPVALLAEQRLVAHRHARAAAASGATVSRHRIGGALTRRSGPNSGSSVGQVRRLLPPRRRQRALVVVAVPLAAAARLRVPHEQDRRRGAADARRSAAARRGRAGRTAARRPAPARPSAARRSPRWARTRRP